MTMIIFCADVRNCSAGNQYLVKCLCIWLKAHAVFSLLLIEKNCNACNDCAKKQNKSDYYFKSTFNENEKLYE